MDPDANLDAQLHLALDLTESDDPKASKLAELVLALDSWLKHDGFLPERWR